jgi:hypothetical protein
MLQFSKRRGTVLRLMLVIGVVIIPLFSVPSKVSAQAGQATKPGLVAQQQAATTNSRIVDLSLQAPAALMPAATLLPTTVVHIIDTSNGAGGWNPSSPDPSGIDYWPLTGRLLVSDSEVDEIPAYWALKNVYDATTSGTLISTCRTTFSSEPSGVAINPNNNHVFFSDDNGATADRVFEVSLGPDGTYCTADDTVVSTPVSTLYSAVPEPDAEDVAYGNNTLFIADGVNAEVYIVPLGANGVLGGGDDGSVTHFDTASLGFHNVEGIGYNGDSGTLFIVSALSAEKFLGETTTAGILLKTYDLTSAGLTHPEDVTYAPGSLTPAIKNIYITDRGLDNNDFPNENDGRIFEINLGIPRVSSILRTNSNPTGAASVNYTVTFSETVTGVDISDFSLTTIGITGATVSGVTGSGTTYTVTVNTGSGNGTIRLDVTDDDSITDSVGLTLGGSGAGNGNFTTGEVYTVTRPNWFVRGVGSFFHGTGTDIPVPADYNGDGKDDVAIFRESNSTWYVYGVGPFVYGTSGDIPVVADYNGDGKDDIAVFRESNSTWYVYGIGSSVYGTSGDIPVVADYNGDGKADIAVFRPSNSTWYVYGVGSFTYGQSGDIPVIGDYNGDGKADIAVFRP